MWWLLVALALGGEPSLKGSKLLDDGQHVMTLKTQSTFGTSVTTLVAKDGTPVVVFSLAPYQESVMLSADFAGLGQSFGGQLARTTPGELAIAWWKAGVLTPTGADLAALEAWAGEQSFALVDTAKEREKLAAYAAANPPPPPSPTPAAPVAQAAPPPAAPAPPAVVSVQLHIDCDERVRLFFGRSPTSGGTYGWESPNAVRSATMKPGDVICICDDRDKVQSCWTAGTERASLEVLCGGFRAR